MLRPVKKCKRQTMEKLSMFDLFIGGNFLETISETLTIENDV